MKKEFDRIKSEVTWGSAFEYMPKQTDIDFLKYFDQVCSEIGFEKTDYKQALRLLKTCQSVFILNMNKSLSEIEIQDCFVQYIKFLNDLPYCYLSEAIDEIIKNQKFFPTIAEIIQKTHEVSSSYGVLHVDVSNLSTDLQARLLPRTKENFDIVRQKEASERSDVESFYIAFMREHYPHFVR
jgi:hypothetical protein